MSSPALRTSAQCGDLHLLEAIGRLQPHDHLCLIYETQEEQFATVVPYMRFGLERGERCFYIVDDNTAEAVLEAMEQGGVDTDLAMRSGALRIMIKSETYLREGRFDPDRMIEFFGEAVAAAKEAGFSALRVAGEMTWALGSEPGSERLIEYEAKLNRFFVTHDALAICQYNRKRFSPIVICDVIRTHPVVISNFMVCRNFYCIPPEEFLAPDAAAGEVDRLLGHIREREAAERLLANHELLENFFSSTHHCVALLDRDFNFVRVNRAYADTCRQEPSYFVGKNHFGLYPHKENEAIFRCVVETGVPHTARARPFEFPDMPERGVTYWDWTLYPVGNAAGLVDGLLFCLVDVTEPVRAHQELARHRDQLENLVKQRTEELSETLATLKAEAEERGQVEAAVRENEARLCSMVDAITESAFLMDPEGTVLACNESVASRLGCGISDLLGKSIYERLPVEVAESRRKHAEQVIASGRTVRFEDERLGRIIDQCLYPVIGQDGKVSAIAVFGQDVTDRKRAERDLRESREQYRRIVETANDGIWSLDVRQATTFVNERMANSLGYTVPEMIARPITDFIFAEDLPDHEARMRKRESGASDRYERRFRHKDGSERWMLVSATALMDDDGRFTGSFGMFTDITDRKCAEQSLERSTRLLDLVRQAQTLFIAQSDPEAVFGSLLHSLVSLTDSQYGFLGEVVREADGQVFKRNLALTNISWDEDSRRLYDQLRGADFEFRNLSNLAGAPVRTGRLVIANDPGRDSRSGGLPPGHPPVNAFMGIPMYFGGELVGVAGVANRPGGYDEDVAAFLEPFISTCAGIIHAARNERKEKSHLEETRLTLELLRILNAQSDLHELLKGVTVFLQDWSGCEAVGIRLRQGNDYPYFESRGFPPEFIEAENSLCAVDENDEPIRDSNGDPVLECMCGNVIYGRFDPSFPFFSANGSFWSNCTTELLASTTEEDRQARTRNRCNGEGYESVALIRLRSGRMPLGLIQLNDKRRDRFSPGMISLLERFAENVGIAIAQRTAEKALDGRTLELDTLFRALPDLYFRVRRDGTILDYRAGQNDDLYVPPAEFLGRPVQSVLPEELGRKHNAVIDEVARTGQPATIEYQLAVPSGKKHFEARVLPLDANELISVIRDITDRKRAEEALRESEERLRLANRATNDVVWDWDIAHDAQRWNEAGTAVFGWTDIVSHPQSAVWWVERVHPDDQQRVDRGFFAVVNNAACSHWQDEYRFRKADGSYAEVVDRGYVLRDSQGKALRMIGAMLDVTERKRAEQSLRKLADEWQTTFDAVGDAVWLLDADCRILRGNKASVSLLGSDPSEVVGRPCWELVHGTAEPPCECPFRRLQQSLRRESEELLVGDRWCRVTLDPILDADGKLAGAVHVISDMTERKQEEKEKEVLGRLASRLAACRDIAGMIELVEQETDRLLPSDAGFFAVRPPDGDVLQILHFVDTVDGQKRTLPARPWSLDDSSETLAALLKGESVLLNRDSGEHEVSGFRRFGDESRISRSLMFVPIRSGDSTIGVLSLQSYNHLQYGEDDLRVLQRIADLAAPAVERAWAEEELGESEARYRALAENYPNGALFLFDQELRFLAADGEGLAEVGLSPDQVIGRTVEEVFPELRETVEPYCRLAIKGQSSTYEVVYKERVYSCHTLPISDEAASIAHGLIVAQDVTERKRAEDSLRASEARFRSYFQLPLIGVAITSPEKGWVEVNDRVCGILGYTREELVRMTWAELTHPDDLDADVREFERMLAGEIDQYAMEKRFLRKDGIAVETDLAVSCVRRNDGVVDYVVALIQDITERKRAAAERRHLEEHLRQSQKLEALGQLAAGVAHDFSNMLTVIRGQTHMAYAAAGQDSQMKGHLRAIEDAVSQSMDITKSLLTFSRVMPTDKKPVQLGEVVQDARKLLKHALPACVHVVTEIEPACECVVMVDRTQFYQVLLNLAINARDAMPRGGTLRLGVATAVVPEGSACLLPAGTRCVRLSVADTGTGIESGILPRIFDPFFTTKDREQGTGLGLSLVHGIVADHQGYIEVESQVGKGTTVTITLPSLSPDEESPSDSAGPASSSTSELVLVASPDAFQVGAVSGYLQSIGYRVLLAEDEDRVLQLLEKHGADVRLVILRADIPHHGGPACIRRCRKRIRGLPAILLSCGLPLSDDVAGKNTLVIDGPVVLGELGRLVREALGLKERTRQ